MCSFVTPWMTCRFIAACGCLVHFMGYFMVWAAAKGLVPMPFWLLAMFALSGSAAVVFFDAAAIVCCMRNFPNERGNSAGTYSEGILKQSFLLPCRLIIVCNPRQSN